MQTDYALVKDGSSISRRSRQRWGLLAVCFFFIGLWSFTVIGVEITETTGKSLTGKTQLPSRVDQILSETR